MGVSVTTSDDMSFRYGHRANGRRETLTIGRYGKDLPDRTFELVDMMIHTAIDTVGPRDNKPVIHSNRGAHYHWPGWLARIA